MKAQSPLLNMLQRKCKGDSLEISKCFSLIIKWEKQGNRKNVLLMQTSMTKTLSTKILKTGIHNTSWGGFLYKNYTFHHKYISLCFNRIWKTIKNSNIVWCDRRGAKQTEPALGACFHSQMGLSNNAVTRKL